MANIDIKGSSAKGIAFKGGKNRSGSIGGNGGMPVYIGARAVVTRTGEGVKITLSDYKGTTEEIVAEAISDVITNQDGSITFILPDGREITTESLMVKDYEALENLPSINGETLMGDKTFEDLGDSPLTNLEIQEMFNHVFND